jgi:uncharacterized YccA/Bax inhibitor family protein
MATGNPAMNAAVYRRAERADTSAGVMTLPGTVVKTALLVLILLVTATYTWSQASAGATGVAYGWLIAGSIGGFSLLVTLIWMYLEILRLLAKLRGSRD